MPHYPPRTHLTHVRFPTRQHKGTRRRRRPLTPFRTRAFSQHSQNIKPRGFWYGMRGAWVEHNEPDADRMSRCRLYRVVLPRALQTTLDAPHPDKVLVLRTKADLLAFADKYGVCRPWRPPTRRSKPPRGGESYRRSSYSSISSVAEERKVGILRPRQPDWNLVRWRAVARDFGGLEIPSFQRAYFMHKFDDAWWDPRLQWYDWWDVPSGCLWGERVLRAVGSRLEVV